MLLELDGAHNIQFAVEIRMEHGSFTPESHVAPPGRAPAAIARAIGCARELDLTSPCRWARPSRRRFPCTTFPRVRAAPAPHENLPAVHQAPREPCGYRLIATSPLPRRAALCPPYESSRQIPPTDRRDD